MAHGQLLEMGEGGWQGVPQEVGAQGSVGGAVLTARGALLEITVLGRGIALEAGGFWRAAGGLGPGFPQVMDEPAKGGVKDQLRDGSDRHQNPLD
jgi:hypothetical protein